jgi:predicted acylesterase/phospholipase RssA
MVVAALLARPNPFARRCKDRPDALVIAGGGAKGISALGAVHALRTAGRLKDVRVVAGTSAGAIVAASVALDRSATDLLKKIVRDEYAPDLNIRDFASTFGIDSGAQVSRWIDAVLEGPMTFADVHATTGKDLIVVATNLTNRGATYFSRASHPDMDVATAIRMSCAIPLYFSSIKHDGCVYVDGGVTDNFCYEHVAGLKGVRNPLGIAYRYTGGASGPVDTPEKYLVALVHCATVHQSVRDGANVLHVDCGDVGVFAFKKVSEMKRLFKHGVMQTRDWLKKIV